MFSLWWVKPLIATALVAAGFFAGTRWVMADWNAEKAQQAEALAAKTTQAMEDSRRMAIAQRAKDNAYEAQIRSIGGQLADALVSLRNRPERLPEPANPTCAGSSGAVLSGPDARFLIGEAARADELRAALARCQGTPIPAE